MGRAESLTKYLTTYILIYSTLIKSKNIKNTCFSLDRKVALFIFIVKKIFYSWVKIVKLKKSTLKKVMIFFFYRDMNIFFMLGCGLNNHCSSQLRQLLFHPSLWDHFCKYFLSLPLLIAKNWFHFGFSMLRISGWKNVD